MSKVYNYMIFAVGLTFLLKFAGLPTGAESILLSAGIAENNFDAFLDSVAAIFGIGLTLGGIVAGLFNRGTAMETVLISAFASGFLALVTGSFISILYYTKDMGYVYYIVWLIFAPLIVAFSAAIINFWRGSDS